MEILKYPNQRLLTPCKEVKVFTPELHFLLESMYETMIDANGMGLAANQVGLEYRMFTMKGPKDEKIFLVNPRITNLSLQPANLKEGCLSAPGEFLILPNRVNWVKVEYENEKGETKFNVFFGIHAVCVQHEMEHLEGKTHLQSPWISKKMRLALAKKWGLRVK